MSWVRSGQAEGPQRVGSPAGGYLRKWATDGVTRFAALLAVVAALMLALAVSVTGGVSLGIEATLWCLTVLAAIAVRQVFFVPFIAVSASAVVVRGAWSRHEIPFTELLSVEPGYTGLLIRRNDGPAVVASAVQRANGDRWRGRRSRADVVADDVMSRFKQADG